MLTIDLQNQKSDKKICAEEGNFLPRAPVDSSITMKVQDGLELMLSHFSEPLFPRKVSTAATRNAQEPAQTVSAAMKYYQDALWLDCRIAAFGMGQTNPDLIFIDLDDKDFCSPRAIKIPFRHCRISQYFR